MFDTVLPSIENLRKAPVKFRYGSHKRRVLIDSFTASAVLKIYDAADADNQASLTWLWRTMLTW